MRRACVVAYDALSAWWIGLLREELKRRHAEGPWRWRRLEDGSGAAEGGGEKGEEGCEDGGKDGGEDEEGVEGCEEGCEEGCDRVAASIECRYDAATFAPTPTPPFRIAWTTTTTTSTASASVDVHVISPHAPNLPWTPFVARQRRSPAPFCLVLLPEGILLSEHERAAAEGTVMRCVDTAFGSDTTLTIQHATRTPMLIELASRAECIFACGRALHRDLDTFVAMGVPVVAIEVKAPDDTIDPLPSSWWASIDPRWSFLHTESYYANLMVRIRHEADAVRERRGRIIDVHGDRWVQALADSIFTEEMARRFISASR